MAFLRAVLRWQAIAWAAAGAMLLLAPGVVAGGLLGRTDDVPHVWPRALGIAAVVLAAQMVLVGRRIEELWWWCWSFVVLEAGAALVLATHALLGTADGESAAPWWALAVACAAVAGLQVWGLARAGMERSPV